MGMRVNYNFNAREVEGYKKSGRVVLVVDSGTDRNVSGCFFDLSILCNGRKPTCFWMNQAGEEIFVSISSRKENAPRYTKFIDESKEPLGIELRVWHKGAGVGKCSAEMIPVYK